MSKKRIVEIFSAGCAVCDETVQLVNQISCESCDVRFLDMNQPDVIKQANKYGIKTVPTVVIDGKIADCCANQGANEDMLRAIGFGTPLSI